MNETSGEKVTGIVDRIIFQNRENGYNILNVELPGEKNVTITVSHPKVHEGLTYEFEGKWTVHPKFGKQMQATAMFEIAPNTKEGLRAYLASSFFPGIGPVIANRIIKYFGDDVIKIFNEDIERLTLVPGISPKKLDVIKKSWEENDEINNVMMFLQQFGISTVYAAKIYKSYGKDCVSQIKENPYKMARDIDGIGFKYADKIAIELGLEEDSEERIRACISHILESGSLDGHCYLTKEQITNQSTELLNVDIRDKVENILKYMISDNEIKTLYLEDENKDTRFYSKKLFYNEKKCANIIGDLLKNKFNVNIPEDTFDDSNLSDEQKSAVTGIVKEGISVLTGAAGCGKTHTTKTILDLFLNLNKEVSLCAPTGRASQKMTESTGMQAATIHRLLGWDPESFGFLHNEKNQLDIDVLIVDESSMIDINLASSLLKAVPKKCQVIFIGDFNQLPSVSAGNFFKDLIESGVVPVFKLTKIFRQGKESEIIKFAHQINKGENPEIKSPFYEPSIWTDGTDCMFIDSDVKRDFNNNIPRWSSLNYGLDVIDMTKKLYNEIIPKYKNTKDIQILIPFKVSDLGTIKMNEIIQNSANPPSNLKNEIKIKDKIFREGDKIIHTVNNYDLEVFNGDIGKIITISDDYIDIEFLGERIVKYKKTDMVEVELAYAISCHKSQGSEFKCVILPIMTNYSRMLYRNLLYTSITRGRTLVVFVGQRKALKMSIDNINPLIRQTSLKELLIEADEINSLVI